MEKITLLGGCYVKIKGIIVVLIIAVMILPACGKEKVDYRESLMAGVYAYIQRYEKDPSDVKTDIEFINSVLPQYEGEDKEKFVKIAEFMVEGNASEVKKLYEELEKK